MKLSVKISRVVMIVTLVAIFTVSCTFQSVHIPQDASSSGVEYASRFTLERGEGYTRLDIIDPWQGSEGVRHIYILIKEETTVPLETFPAEAKIINVPIKSIVCMSATHVAMIAALGMENTIIGVSGTDLIANAEVRNLAVKGLIKEVGYEESLNREEILNMNPDLFMAYGIGSESAGFLSKISGLGIKVMLNAEYLELDPLGKAEWIKVFGALYCLEEMADSLFNSSSEKYSNLKKMIAEETEARPKILLGLPWKDSWYISPGNSYISRLIEDAGGEYLWRESESKTSMPLNLENVYMKAIEAEFWLNPGNARTLNEIAIADRRLAGLAVFTNGNIFNNIKLLSATGANDYWERGSTNPELILADIATILHPELFKDDTLTFYKRLN